MHVGEDDRLVDLVREGLDCVLRAGVLQDSTLIARSVASLEQVTVASPEYLARHGTPRNLDDLAGHFAVDDVSSATGRPMPLEFTTGSALVTKALRAKISVTGADLYTGAALTGLGLVQVPRYRIAHDIASGRLAVVLPHQPPPPMPVSVLYPGNRQLSARVRVFIQWLTERFVACA